jgi:hypothetical protein
VGKRKKWCLKYLMHFCSDRLPRLQAGGYSLPRGEKKNLATRARWLSWRHGRMNAAIMTQCLRTVNVYAIILSIAVVAITPSSGTADSSSPNIERGDDTISPTTCRLFCQLA